MAEALLTFADKMKREELIREYEEAIALDMYQDMTSYIEHCCGDLRYETFTEDLRTFMDGKLRQYINAYRYGY